MAQDLPIADYDQLPITELRHRIRALDEPALRAVFEHETEHGNRIPVLEVLHARLNELTHGAEPSPGDPANAPGQCNAGRFVRAGIDGGGGQHPTAARRRESDSGARQALRVAPSARC